MGRPLIEELEEHAETSISACYQCHKCASGCPTAMATEFLPSQIIQMIRLGKDDEVLALRGIWLCVTCATCTSRCPMGIDLAAVMDHLRQRAVEDGAAPIKTPERIFNDAFLKSVRRHGRVYEMGLMTGYKMRSGDFKSDMDKFPSMVKKGKISLFPSREGDKAAVRKIMVKVKK